MREVVNVHARDGCNHSLSTNIQSIGQKPVTRSECICMEIFTRIHTYTHTHTWVGRGGSTKFREPSIGARANHRISAKCLGCIDATKRR